MLARAEAERQAPDQAPGGRSLLQRWVASVLQPGGGAQAAGARIQALQDEVCAHAPASAQRNSIHSPPSGALGMQRLWW